MLLSNKANVELGHHFPDGVDLNNSTFNSRFKDVEDRTPLMVACFRGKEETAIDIIQILLNYGCDIFATSKGGNTTIHYAARYGYHKRIELIYNHLINSQNPKYDKNKINNFMNQQSPEYNGKTAYHLAVGNHNYQTVETLLKLCQVDCEIENNDGVKARDLLRQNSEKKKWLIDLESKYSCHRNEKKNMNVVNDSK